MNVRVLSIGFVFLTLLHVAGCAPINVYPPEVFDSPESAVARLSEVVASDDPAQAKKLLGSQGEYLLHSGDPVVDKTRAARFSEMFKARHELRADGEDRYTMLVGEKSWPFPVPLVKRGDTWMFDAEAGRDEVLSRRIGENEFIALDTVRAVYHAQRNYAARDWNGDGVYQYAERLISSPGKQDGLYWPQDDNQTVVSPLGPVVAKAAQESYVITPGGEPQSYHGYYYKLLYTSAPQGEGLDVLSRPGRYWLIATPAVWNESGVMTFALNERGWIYEKDLGADFDYTRISDLEVDDSWQRVE
jgi:hypothetical protein